MGVGESDVYIYMYVVGHCKFIGVLFTELQIPFHAGTLLQHRNTLYCSSNVVVD